MAWPMNVNAVATRESAQGAERSAGGTHPDLLGDVRQHGMARAVSCRRSRVPCDAPEVDGLEQRQHQRDTHGNEARRNQFQFHAGYGFASSHRARAYRGDKARRDHVRREAHELVPLHGRGHLRHAQAWRAGKQGYQRVEAVHHPDTSEGSHRKPRPEKRVEGSTIEAERFDYRTGGPEIRFDYRTRGPFSGSIIEHVESERDRATGRMNTRDSAFCVVAPSLAPLLRQSNTITLLPSLGGPLEAIKALAGADGQRTEDGGNFSSHTVRWLLFGQLRILVFGRDGKITNPRVRWLRRWSGAASRSSCSVTRRQCHDICASSAARIGHRQHV